MSSHKDADESLGRGQSHTDPNTKEKDEPA